MVAKVISAWVQPLRVISVVFLKHDVAYWDVMYYSSILYFHCLPNFCSKGIF